MTGFGSEADHEGHVERCIGIVAAKQRTAVPFGPQAGPGGQTLGQLEGHTQIVDDERIGIGEQHVSVVRQEGVVVDLLVQMRGCDVRNFGAVIAVNADPKAKPE